MLYRISARRYKGLGLLYFFSQANCSDILFEGFHVLKQPGRYCFNIVHVLGCCVHSELNVVDQLVLKVFLCVGSIDVVASKDVFL